MVTLMKMIVMMVIEPDGAIIVGGYKGDMNVVVVIMHDWW